MTEQEKKVSMNKRMRKRCFFFQVFNSTNLLVRPKCLGRRLFLLAETFVVSSALYTSKKVAIRFTHTCLSVKHRERASVIYVGANHSRLSFALSLLFLVPIHGCVRVRMLAWDVCARVDRGARYV